MDDESASARQMREDIAAIRVYLRALLFLAALVTIGVTLAIIAT